MKWLFLIQKDLRNSVKFKGGFESDSVNYSEPLLSLKIILNRETLVIKYDLFLCCQTFIRIQNKSFYYIRGGTRYTDVTVRYVFGTTGDKNKSTMLGIFSFN